MRHHIRLIFIFLVEIGFHHVGQAALELLASCDPPTSASQSAGITGVKYSEFFNFSSKNQYVSVLSSPILCSPF